MDIEPLLVAKCIEFGEAVLNDEIWSIIKQISHGN